jgi:hypothetical protein
MDDAPPKTDPYIEELFQKIKDDKIGIDPAVWALLTHVLGNRVYSITLIVGDYLDTPRWILKAGTLLMRFLYKISGNKGKLYDLETILKKALLNTYMIRDFLRRLRDSTERKEGF